jgi:hypothetical protein
MPFRHSIAGMRVLSVIVLSAAAACSSGHPGAPPSEAPVDRSEAPVDRSEKPGAAVTVAISDRDLGGGDHELTLTATPTRAVTGFEMELDGQHVTVGATAAGEARTLTARVHLGATEGRDIVGTAWIGDAGHRRNRAALAHIGAIKAEAPTRTRIVTMPDGTVVEEVRP